MIAAHKETSKKIKVIIPDKSINYTNCIFILVKKQNIKLPVTKLSLPLINAKIYQISSGSLSIDFN